MNFNLCISVHTDNELELRTETGQEVPVRYGGPIMGSGHSSVEEHLLCCTPSSNTIYDDKQLAVLKGYKDQLGLDKKQLLEYVGGNKTKYFRLRRYNKV